MKNIYLIPFITFTTLALRDTSYSPDTLNRIINKVKQRAATKIDNAIDKGPDEAEGKNKRKVIQEVEVKQKNKNGRRRAK